MLSRSSFTSLVVGVFAVYVAHTCWVMYGIVCTRPCPATAPGPAKEERAGGAAGCVWPYLARRPKLQLSVYTTTRSNIGAENNIDLILNVEDFDIESRFERTVNVSVPKKTRNNGTLYAYIFLHHAGILPWHDGKQVHIVSPLTTYMVPKPEEVNLITGESTTQQIEAEKKQTNALDEPVSHWRSRLTLNVMVEDFVFDGSSLPADVHRYMKMVQLGKTVHYLPILFIDQLSNRVKDLMIINRSTTELPLTVSYDKISLGKLRFWIHMQDAVFSLQQFGFSEKDADEVKGIFVDTNLYFLALTFFVAAFHQPEPARRCYLKNIKEVLLEEFLLLFQEMGRNSVRWWTFQQHFLTSQRCLRELLMEQEEQDTDVAGLNWMLLLMTLGIATDTPYWHF